jgi:DNA primase
VAVLGSGLTAEQAVKLSRLPQHVLIAFDNDEAGRAGARAASEMLESPFLNVELCPVPDGFKDVAEMPVEEVRRWLGPRMASVELGF